MAGQPGPPATELAAYLARLEPAGQSDVTWAGGTLPLRLTAYFGDEAPPEVYVSSVRCIVFRGDAVLVVRQGQSAHVVPGGRREPGETLAQTLERELLEETGWTVGPARLIGVVHLRHLGPRPESVSPDSPLYPDFLWLIYTAEALAERPGSALPGYPEGVPSFVPLTEIDAQPIGSESRLFLARAVSRRPRLPATRVDATRMARTCARSTH